MAVSAWLLFCLTVVLCAYFFHVVASICVVATFGAIDWKQMKHCFKEMLLI